MIIYQFTAAELEAMFQELDLAKYRVAEAVGTTTEETAFQKKAVAEIYRRFNYVIRTHLKP